MAPPFEQNVITHGQGQFVCDIKDSVEQLWRKRFSKVCVKFAMFVFRFYFTNNLGGTTV